MQPHPGTSYNPSLDSHQQLLRTAHEVEARREAEADKYRDVKTTMEAARRAVTESDVYEGAPGMIVDVPGEDDEDSEGEDDIDAEAVRMPGRKTKQKKRKSAEVLEEVSPPTNSIFHHTTSSPILTNSEETRRSRTSSEKTHASLNPPRQNTPQNHRGPTLKPRPCRGGT